MLVAYMTVEDRNENDDPWTRARAAARDDVQAVLAPRARRCPACGEEQRDGGRTCGNCGADLTARYAKGGSRRKLIYAGLAVLVLVAVSVPIIGGLREDAAGERERASAREEALAAAERVRLTRESRPVRADGTPAAAGADPLEHRAALVAEGETLIAADARARESVKSKIRGAQCDPYPTTAARRAAEQDAATPVGRYDCVAYTSKFELPGDEQQRTGLFGYPYWLVIDYADAKLVWCKISPRASEGGRSLAFVTAPEPCQDPPGPG